MAGSRAFARGDYADFALGIAPTAAFTLMVVLKPASASANQTWMCDRSASAYVFGIDEGSIAIFESGGRANYALTPLPVTSGWQNMMYAKSAGAATGVFSRLPIGGGSMVGSDADGGGYPDLAATVGWRVGRAMSSGHEFAGSIAAIAIFNQYIGSAGRATATTIAAIEALRPLHLWDERDGFTSDRGSDGSADRTAISGTSHTTDEPTGFWGAGPATPGGTMVGVGDRRAVVFWSEVSDATAYKVRRDGVEIHDGAGIGDRGTVAFEDTGLTNGTSYSYTVAAYDGAGRESAESTAIVVRPLAPTAQASGSRSFGGSDLVRFVPGIESQEQPEATFVLVLKPDSVSSATGLLRADASASQGDSSDPFVLRTSSSGELILDVYNPDSTSISASAIRLTAGVWQMIAVTFTTPNRAPPRFHHKNLATGVVTHTDGSPDHTYTIHPHGTWTVGDRFSGLIALAAVIETIDDGEFEALDLAAVTTLAHAQWDERDEFLGDRSRGDALALRNAITGTTHSTDSPPSLWPSTSNRLTMVL